MKKPNTLTECFDIYLNQGQLYSPHTRSAYSRSVTLFLNFLGDLHAERVLPVQRLRRTPSQLAPTDFVAGDERILVEFANWLRSTPSSTTIRRDKRPYSEATIALRIAGVQHFFAFMERRGWLAPEFEMTKVVRLLREESATEPTGSQKKGKTTTYNDLSAVISFYDHQQLPPHLQGENVDQQRVERWELVRLRNRALLHALAETGGRVSELLQLDVTDVLSVDEQNARIIVLGKGGHQYQLDISRSRRKIADYLDRRGLDEDIEDAVPLFVSHDPRYDGNRMSRIVAWRVVRRASKGVGMSTISPHDFRHWRAHQLIQQGKGLEDIRDALGHRSVETVKSLYEHWLTGSHS